MANDTSSLAKTIHGLQEKHDFLVQQRSQYADIKQKILDPGEIEDADQHALVLGDVVISKDKFYLNLGYEYYVEKTRSEIIQFLGENLKLMDEAIVRFQDKLQEANLTLQNIKMLMENEGEDEQLPSMEIREELDDDGNIINSSVTPTNKKIPPSQEVKMESSFEKNLKGKLLPQKQEPAPVSRDDMYTFADLVDQLDKEDFAAHGEIDSNDIHYDYDSYDGFLQDEDESSSDSEDESLSYSMIPGIAAQTSFIQQIQKLRSSQKASAIEPPKSILKKDKSTKPKKSLGFAKSLDIHEIENLKEETRQNTFELRYTPDVDASNADFDADLFAQMLGVQGSDELHDKYTNVVEEEYQKEEEEAKQRITKKRVSRFKKDRHHKCTVSIDDSVTIDDKVINPVSDVIERKVDDEAKIVSTSPEKGKSKFAKEFTSLQKPKTNKEDRQKLNRELLDKLEPTGKSEVGAMEADLPSETFPDKINEVINVERPQIKVAKVDFHALGDNLDDMVRAYNVGVYDDDLEEDPGTVLEKLDDIREYNKIAEELEDEIKEFKIENPIETSVNDQETDEDGPVMTDIMERDIPADYENDKESVDTEEFSLHSSYLNKSITMEYHNLKSQMKVHMDMHIHDEEKQLEPIDEFGNPVQQSRFKSQIVQLPHER